MGEESFVYTCCPGWGDHEFCAIKTIVRDGKIVRTEKAQYTGAEAKRESCHAASPTTKSASRIL